MKSGPDHRPRERYNGNRPPQQQQRTPQRNQTFDSHGPDVRVRGSAHQIFERYVALAREAASAGERVAAENLYQHAEHYFRVDNASRDRHQQSTSPQLTDAAVSETDQGSSEADPERAQTGWGDDRPGFL
jgi:hypothetical protein